MKRLALLLALAACGQGGGGDDDLGDDAPGDFRTDHTGFVQVLEPYRAYAGFYDGPFDQPPPEAAASAGDCAIYHHPDCTDCATPVSPLSAGDITITGLRVAATLTPSDYGYVAPELPEDVFADDAAIHLAAAGADLPAFGADLTGVAPLAITSDRSIVLEDGVPEVITWTPAPGDARIQVALYLGWHGAPWSDLLICETDDDGSLTIPTAVIAEMSHFDGVGLFQWPSAMMRFRRTWIEGPYGAIEILVGSTAGVDVIHPTP